MDLDIMLYVVTGVYGFLIIFLFAFVIHLYQKVQKLSNDDDDDDDDRSDIRSPPREQQQQPDFAEHKPVRPQGRSHNNNDLPERNYGHNDSPERNLGHSSSPDRSHGHNNFRGDKDFGGIDFNKRMAPEVPFKPASSQGGSFKNPLFDQGPSQLENRYDYAGSRDKQHSKPHVPAPGFRLPTSGFNQPNNNNLYPRREYQNNNFRY